MSQIDPLSDSYNKAKGDAFIHDEWIERTAIS